MLKKYYNHKDIILIKINIKPFYHIQISIQIIKSQKKIFKSLYLIKTLNKQLIDLIEEKEPQKQINKQIINIFNKIKKKNQTVMIIINLHQTQDQEVV